MTDATPQETHARIAIAPTDKAVNVTFHDAVIATTRHALVLEERGHEPVLYVPAGDVATAFLTRTDKRTTCPYKGEASYWSVSAEGAGAADAVWSYETPREGVEAIAGHMAFDPKLFRITAA